MVEGDGGFPAEGGDAGDIKELAGGAVRHGGVPVDFPGEAGGGADVGGEFGDGEVLTAADVDWLGGVIDREEVEAGAGEVITVEEFTPWGAGAPEGDAGIAAGLGLVEFADHGGEDVGVLRVEIVAGAVEVGGHGADEAGAELLAVGLAEADAGDFGDGVGVVGGFERAGEEGRFGDGLGGVFGVNAGAAEEEKFFDAGGVGGGDDVVLDLQVIEEEIDGVGAVGVDAADLGGSKDDVVGFLFLKEAEDRGGITQVEFLAGAGEGAEAGVGGAGAEDGAADQAAVAGDEEGALKGIGHGGFVQQD